MKNLQKVVSAVEALSALFVLAAVNFFAPVCQKMLTLENGNSTHMKCWFSSRAAIVLAVVMLAAAVASFLAKKEHKAVQLVSIAAAVMLFLTVTSLIGVCASAEMACHKTALCCKIAAGVTLVAALVDIFGGREGQIPG